ncbi:MAG: nucleotidyl transferase AbiEii/AbiGii toxin family protein [Oligoflexia bacterium]|nr:nucleotidyl transferase AbiEii/AbiGii toxin family protein [Oligoflexia bacterium]MBF0367485.1 nucleotidyl transferase AbiEii/AbiGii toxin family protein [Oligoflexia bacterium]
MKDVIQKKLESYECQSSDDEENAIKEITQEVALYALAKSGFFKEVSFKGGTCLRIVHGLDRFSEDLDFVTNSPNKHFDLSSYLKIAVPLINLYGYQFEVDNSKKDEGNIKKGLLKDNSIKKIMTFKHYSDVRKKIKIKLEVDINPPSGALIESDFLNFPTEFSLSVHGLSSLFAGKCHALLCRNYVKGRDWYDFAWYVNQGIEVNYNMLSAALTEMGPWQGKKLCSDRKWLVKNLSEKIISIDFIDAINDLTRFIKPEKRAELELWSEKFFLKKVDKLK